MTGVKMGDRIVQIGCAHAGRIWPPSIACQSPGHLRARAAAFVPGPGFGGSRSASRARAKRRALVEVETGRPTRRFQLDERMSSISGARG